MSIDLSVFASRLLASFKCQYTLLLLASPLIYSVSKMNLQHFDINFLNGTCRQMPHCYHNSVADLDEQIHILLGVDTSVQCYTRRDSRAQRHSVCCEKSIRTIICPIKKNCNTATQTTKVN